MNEIIMEGLYSGNNYRNIYDLDNEEIEDFDYSVYNKPHSQELFRQELFRQESPSPSIKNLINYDSNSDDTNTDTDTDDDESVDEFSDEFSDDSVDKLGGECKLVKKYALPYDKVVKIFSMKNAIYVGVLSVLYYYW